MASLRRVLVTGSRDWRSPVAVAFALINERAKGEFILVHGDCPTGADRHARDHAELNGIPHEPHPADWAAFGKSAGPRRNQEMVDLGADVCHAFPLGESRGTRHCMVAARAAGIPVILHETAFTEDAEMPPQATGGPYRAERGQSGIRVGSESARPAEAHTATGGGHE